jgi:glutathione synthase/RimK-type ligase-like ATP-grasp enzyme
MLFAEIPLSVGILNFFSSNFFILLWNYGYVSIIRFVGIISPMHKNIEAVRQALHEMNTDFSEIEGFYDAVMIKGYAFVRAVTPFNNGSIASLCRDKAAVYTLLKGIVPMPETISVLDKQGTYAVLAHDVSLDILYPRIVKMNSGERGDNVYFVSNKEEAQSALASIFDKNSSHYDYLALIQEYIKPVREIRVVVAEHSVAFAYDRSSAELLSSDAFEKVVNLSEKVLQRLTITWGALDFIESESGELFFLEVNTRPGFNTFIEKNGNRLLVDLYKASLRKFLE